MERLDVNSALLHISLLMEHRGGGEVWQKNGRWCKNINCYFDKFCAWYWFPIPMSQIYQTSQKHQNSKEETSTMKKFSFYYQRPKAIKRTMKKLFIWSQAKIQYFQLKERPRQKCFFRKCAFLLPHRIWDFVTLAQAVVGAKRCQREPKSFSHKFASSWTFPIFPTGLPSSFTSFPLPSWTFPTSLPSSFINRCFVTTTVAEAVKTRRNIKPGAKKDKMTNCYLRKNFWCLLTPCWVFQI